MILISVQLHRVVPELRRGDVPRGIDRCRLVVLAAAAVRQRVTETRACLCKHVQVY